jgi:hypothetical protein
MEPVVLTIAGGSEVRVFLLELPGPQGANALTVTFERSGRLRRIRFHTPYPVEEVFALVNGPGEVAVRDITRRQLERYRFGVEFLGPEGDRHEFMAFAVEELEAADA